MRLVGACVDCRHWTRRNGDDSGLWDSETDAAANRAAYEQWGHCATAFSEGAEPQFPGTKAYAEDYESYKATLLTREDFGCVQWEAHPSGDAVREDVGPPVVPPRD